MNGAKTERNENKTEHEKRCETKRTLNERTETKRERTNTNGNEHGTNANGKKNAYVTNGTTRNKTKTHETNVGRDEMINSHERLQQNETVETDTDGTEMKTELNIYGTDGIVMKRGRNETDINGTEWM